MARFVAFLRAVNVGSRRVDMGRARAVLASLGYDDVSSYVNSGNLLFSGSGPTTAHEATIRPALEDEFGLELTTFVRTASQVRSLANEKPFGPIAQGHTHFVLLPLQKLSAAQCAAVESMSNDRDEVVVVGRDVHWLIRARSIETSLGPKRWRDVLDGMPTTARNTTMVERLVARL
jgi:uncharacterized protein (DUF1697 family)